MLVRAQLTKFELELRLVNQSPLGRIAEVGFLHAPSLFTVSADYTNHSHSDVLDHSGRKLRSGIPDGLFFFHDHRRFCKLRFDDAFLTTPIA